MKTLIHIPLGKEATYTYVSGEEDNIIADITNHIDEPGFTMQFLGETPAPYGADSTYVMVGNFYAEWDSDTPAETVFSGVAEYYPGLAVKI